MIALESFLKLIGLRRNHGAPGMDGVSIADFEANLDEELSQLQQELTTWTYQPMSLS